MDLSKVIREELVSETQSEQVATEGMLTEELLGRAISELEAIRSELFDGSGEGEWLRQCEDRLGNALRDVQVSRDRFRKAQT